MAMRSVFSRFVQRVGRSADEVEAEALTAASQAIGAARICDVVDRRLVDVSGDIRTMTLPPRVTVPALVAELYDGTGTMTLVWLGRREIPGITTGARMRVRGRATYRKGVPTIFNPQYELLPRGHGA